MSEISNAMAGLIQGAAMMRLGEAIMLNTLAQFMQMRITPMLLGDFGMQEPAAPDSDWTVNMGRPGTATIDLGDGYRLELDERKSEIHIFDDEGNDTRIWGDPHVDVNGRRIGDFWNTTTFELENGTKVTINTEPWGRNPNAYVASQVVITRGDQAILVDGISQNQRGDLEIQMRNDGRELDAAHWDGLNLTEQGGQWISELTGEQVTRDDFALTRHNREDELRAFEFNRDFSDAMGAWLILGDLGGMMSFARSESGQSAARGETNLDDMLSNMNRVAPTG